MQIEKDAYVFENDTVKIVYSFWANHGILSYSIFNKLSVPLYIDWRKSSYVKNGQKLDYWLDESTAKSAGVYGTSIYGTYYSKGKSTTTKREQIVFIAPKSAIIKDQFLLMPIKKVDISSVAKSEELKKPNNKKTTKVLYFTYSESNSPLVFRNFLTISTSDKFDKETYIDNGFYISKISEMKRKDFWGEVFQMSEYSIKKYNLIPPFQTPQRFYIDNN